jgi:hypothetical protein
MKKEDLKPYFDALAATFDKKIREGQGYQIFDQSENEIDVMEGSPAEYLESLTGKKLSEEVHGNYWFSWGQLSAINDYIEGEPGVQEQLIYSYDVTGFTGTMISFSILKLLDDHYITMNIDGAAYHFFRIEFNEDEVDLSRFIVDYDSENRRHMINMDSRPVEMDTSYVKPDQLEKEYRELMNELYREPGYRVEMIKNLMEMLQGYKKSYLEKFLDKDEIEALEEELQKSVKETDSGKLANLFFKIIFANYR